MRRALKTMALVAGVLFVLIVLRDAFFSNTSYFFMVPGARRSVDGKPAASWLHRGRRGLILTLAHDGARESYLINFPTEKKAYVAHCDKSRMESNPRALPRETARRTI
jgi:hypothetical protein